MSANDSATLPGGDAGSRRASLPFVRRATSAERWGAFVLAVAMLAVCGAAWLLKPDPRGFGTHEQFAFAPCQMQWLFGIPCPFCGMTTSFAHAAHGHFARAFAVQPAGALGFFAAWIGLIGGAIIAMTGWWPVLPMEMLHSRWAWWSALGIVLLAWIYKIVAGAAAR